MGGVSGILYYFKSGMNYEFSDFFLHTFMSLLLGVVRRSCDFAVGGFAVISLVVWYATIYIIIVNYLLHITIGKCVDIRKQS